MKYNVNGETKEITMKVWNGTQYTPDFFNDMECPGLHDEMDEEGIAIVTAERYAEIVEYWQDECRIANEGGYSEQFGDWREYHPEPEELVLFAD